MTVGEIDGASDGLVLGCTVGTGAVGPGVGESDVGNPVGCSEGDSVVVEADGGKVPVREGLAVGWFDGDNVVRGCGTHTELNEELFSQYPSTRSSVAHGVPLGTIDSKQLPPEQKPCIQLLDPRHGELSWLPLQLRGRESQLTPTHRSSIQAEGKHSELRSGIQDLRASLSIPRQLPIG